jgi:hypothetical protein
MQVWRLYATLAIENNNLRFWNDTKSLLEFMNGWPYNQGTPESIAAVPSQ